jgi:Na+/proline symporter
MSFLLDLPSGLGFLIICSATVLVSVLGLHFVRKKYAHEVLKENHEVAAAIFNAFGLLYAVVVAFVVFVVWGRFDDASKNMELEASQAADIFYISRAFPYSTATQIKQALYEYTSSIVDDEIMQMSKGKSSPKTTAAVSKLMGIFLGMDYKTLLNPAIYLAQYRRLRIFAAKDSVPSVIWMVLLLGALIMVSYTYLFGIKKVLPQNLMTAALTITITLILFLVYILDHPFKGAAAIGNEPMKTVTGQMQRSLNKQQQQLQQLQQLQQKLK